MGFLRGGGRGWWRLIREEHAVAVGEETVSLADGFGVGGLDEFTSGESAHEHQEGGAGKVEIGEERAGVLELVGRMNKNAKSRLQNFGSGYPANGASLR